MLTTARLRSVLTAARRHRSRRLCRCAGDAPFAGRAADDQIVGRDHAGVGNYYGPFDAHRVFDLIPKDSLQTRPLKIDWTFWCYKCGGMASGRTCPHADADRLLVSGTKLRKWLSEGSPVPAEFSRPEVLEILRAYYASLDASENVEVKLLP